MRKLNRFLPAALLVIAACASKTPPPAAAPPAQPIQVEEPATTRPNRPGMVPIPSRGLSCRSAIPVAATKESDGVAEENKWIAENYPGATKSAETVTVCDHKPVHKIYLDTANGRQITLFFDVSSWAAQPK